MATTTQTEDAHTPDTESTTTSTQTEAPASTEQALTADKIVEAVEKARAEEKDKLYTRIESTAKDNEELMAKLETEAAERKKLQDRLELLGNEKLSETEKIQKQVETLAQQNADLQTQMDRVAEEATLRVHQSEMRAYVAQRLREEDLTLTELVSGNTKEEVDASIESAKNREVELQARLEKKIRAEIMKSLPQPVESAAPVDAQPKLIDPRNKYDIAKMSSEDYQKLRSELLQQARVRASS